MNGLEDLKFTLWEKYGKRRIYIKGSYENAFLFPNKNGKIEPSRTGTGGYLDSFLFDSLEEALFDIGLKYSLTDFDDAVKILKEKNILK